MKPSSKWEVEDYLKYWKFYIKFQTSRPYMEISWRRWKIDSIFKHMAKYLGKSAEQCKSKDENMKRIYEDQSDIIETAISKLRKVEQTDEEAF